MKKLFLLAIAVLGTSFASQAQNNLSLVQFTQADGDVFALAYGNLTTDICVDSALNPGTPFIYTYVEATGILSRDGQESVQYPSSQRAQVAGLFDGNYYTLYGIENGFNVLARNEAVATYQE